MAQPFSPPPSVHGYAASSKQSGASSKYSGSLDADANIFTDFNPTSDDATASTNAPPRVVNWRCVAALSALSSLYVLCLFAWSTKPTFYGFLTLYPADEAAALHQAMFVENVACAAAFGSALVSNILVAISQLGTTRQEVALYGCQINTIALIHYLSEAAGFSAVYTSATGRPISIARVTMWHFTAPIMVLMLTFMADRSPSDVRKAVGLTSLMLWIAFPGSLVAHAGRHAFHAAAALCLLCVLLNIRSMLSEAIRETSKVLNTANNALLNILSCTTLTLWAAFPIVYFAGEFEFVGPLTEWQIWGVTDTATKVFYNACLMFTSVMTLRTRVAMNAHIARTGEREQLLMEMQSLLESRKNMMGLVSHELRTPLHGVIGLVASLLANSTEFPPAERQSLQMIHTSALRLLNLVNDVLDALTMQRKALVVAPTRTMLYREANDAIATVSTMRKSSVAIKSTIPPSFPAVFVDPARLMQILLNLLGNSMRFTHEGSITISAHVQDDGKHAVLSVADTGIGIKKENQQEIFEAWNTGPESTTRVYGGTGLGLSLVRQLVQAHGGRTWIESEEGRGTTIYAALPVFCEKLHGAPEEPPPLFQIPPIRFEERPQKLQHLDVTGKALVICGDSDPAPMEFLSRMRWVEAVLLNERSAMLEFIEENDLAPDCVILDGNMQGTDANELCSTLRAMLPLLPIIMTTSQGEAAIEASVAAGATDHLVKPYTQEELCARVTAHVSQLKTLPLASHLKALQLDDSRSSSSNALPSDWTRQLYWRLGTGRAHVLHSTVMLIGLHNIPGVVEALGLDRTMALLRTWYSQCAALARPEDVIIVGGMTSAIIVLGNVDSPDAYMCVLRYGRKMLQWAETINASLGEDVAIRVTAGVMTGPVTLTLNAFEDNHRLQLTGPTMRMLRTLRDRALPECIHLAPVLRKQLPPGYLKSVQLVEVMYKSQAMLHLPSTPVSTTDEPTKEEVLMSDLRVQTHSPGHMAAIAMMLRAPDAIFPRIQGATLPSFLPEDIKVEQQCSTRSTTNELPPFPDPGGAWPPSHALETRDATGAAQQMELMTGQCIKLYSQLVRLASHAANAPD